MANKVLARRYSIYFPLLPPTCSTPAVLIHWRILECFVAGLTPDQWAEFIRLIDATHADINMGSFFKKNSNIGDGQSADLGSDI